MGTGQDKQTPPLNKYENEPREEHSDANSQLPTEREVKVHKIMTAKSRWWDAEYTAVNRLSRQPYANFVGNQLNVSTNN